MEYKIDIKPKYSLEIFPPKNTEDTNNLIRKLNYMKFPPEFVSVTYGAGGSNHNATVDLIKRLHDETTIDIAAHLTLVNSSILDVKDLIKLYSSIGIKKIVALRGDPPGNLEKPYEPYIDGFQKTSDLIKEIKNLNTFKVYIAGYPEIHPESLNKEYDINTLKSKVDAGGDIIITQFFFNNQFFYSFLETLKNKNINIPVMPGIVPIVNYSAIEKFANKCGTKIPNLISKKFLNANESSIKNNDLCINIAVNQIVALLENGIKEFHLYSLNHIQLIEKIWITAINNY